MAAGTTIWPPPARVAARTAPADEAGGDQRGAARGDGHEGVQGQDNVEDRPAARPQAQGRDRNGKDTASVARGKRRRNSVAPAAAR